MTIIIMILAGILAGVVSGLGIGGGAVLIPCLTIFAGLEQHTAQTINLIYFVPTAVIALITHIKNKNINKRLVKHVIFYGLLSAIAGALLALWLNKDLLRKMFGYFLLVIGLYEILKKEQNSSKNMG